MKVFFRKTAKTPVFAAFSTIEHGSYAPRFNHNKNNQMKSRNRISHIMLAVMLVAVFSLMACRQNPQLDAVHQEAVELTEAMRLSHKGMAEKLDYLKTANGEFKRKLNDLSNPADSLHRIIALQDKVIKDFEKMYRKQKRLIDENEDIIKRHERRSISAEEMRAQHQIVRENYEQLQGEAAAIVLEVKYIQVRIDKDDLTANKSL